MKARRAFALVVASGAGAVAVVAACSFPEATFAPGADGGSAEASTDDAQGSAVDAAQLEATTRDDATARVPDGSCLPDDCDCDGDFFVRNQCDSGAKPDAQFDCDDLDPLRKPDAGFTKEVPPTGQVPLGDWNCDGKAATAYSTGLKCTAGLGGCSGGSGFKDTPGCGAEADYFECKDLGLTNGGCQAVKVDTRQQLCK